MQKTDPNVYLIELGMTFSIKDVPENTEAFAVDEEHTEYSEINGLLYDKDGTKLIAVPPMRRNVVIKKSSIRKIAFNNSHVISITFAGWTDIPQSFASILGLTPQLESVIIGAGTVSICDQAFANCKKLKKVELPDTLVTIGDEAFNGCEALQDINIPDSVETIGKEVFNGCKSIRLLNVPTAIQEIGTKAFNDCSGLEGGKIVFPESLVRIGEGAFYNTKIKVFEFKGIPESLSGGTLPTQYAIEGSELEKIIIPDKSLIQFKKILGGLSYLFRYARKEPKMDNFITICPKDKRFEVSLNINNISAIDGSQNYQYYYIYLVGKEEPYEVEKVSCIEWINRFFD